MISTPWLDQARALAPSLFEIVDANPMHVDWAYIRAQILALQVQAHLHPLEAFVPLDIEDKAKLDPRHSEIECFVAGRADLKQVTLFGSSQGSIWFGENSRIHTVSVRAESGEGRVVFGPNTEITNCDITFGNHNTSLIIGSGTTLNGVNLLVQESGNYILIGDDNMWANGISVRTSDSHGIYDRESRLRINYGRPVIVHRHVWVGRHTCMNAGTEIGADAVIGQYCLTGSSMRGGVSYLGNPAMPGRRDITWDRTLADTLDEADIIHPSRIRQLNHIKSCAAIDALAGEPTDELSDTLLLSRVLAANFPANLVPDRGCLLEQAHRLRVWSTEHAKTGVNMPFGTRRLSAEQDAE